MRKTLVTTLSVLLCFSIIGCSKEKSINDSKTIVWRVAAVGNDKELMKGIIDIWEKPLNELLKEKGSNYKVQIKPYSNNGDNSQVEDLLRLKNKDEQTDVITILSSSIYPEMTNWHDNYKESAKKGILLNLDNWKEDNKKILDQSMTSYDYELSKINGKLYGISSNTEYTVSTKYAKKGINELGVKQKDIDGNFFDNSDLLLQAKNQYNEVPVKNMSFGADSLGLFRQQPSNNLAWKKNEGFISISKSLEFKNLIDKFLALKQAGLFDTDYVAQKSLPFASDGIPVSKRESFEGKFAYLSLTQPPQQEDSIIVPNLSIPNMQLYWGDNKTGIASWSRNTKNAEDFLVKLFTDKDVANLIQYGVEGKNYTIDDNNNIIVNDKNTMLPLFGFLFTNSKITYSSNTEEQDKIAYSEWFYATYSENFPTGFRFDPNPVLNEINATNEILADNYLNKTESEWSNKLSSLSINNLDDFLIQLNSALDDAGMQKIVDEANHQYAKWTKENM